MTQQIQHQLLPIVVSALENIFLAWTQENSAKVQTSTDQMPCFEPYEICNLIQSKWNIRRKDLYSWSRSVLKSLALFPCAQFLVLSSSWQKLHTKPVSLWVEDSCAFTPTDMDFILPEGLDTQHIMHVCVENRVPEMK